MPPWMPRPSVGESHHVHVSSPYATNFHRLAQQVPPSGSPIVIDLISRRSIGPSSYHQQNNALPSRRQWAALARPSPSSPRKVECRQRTTKKHIWILLCMTGPLQVKAEGHACKMKKITHFIIPSLKIELPSDTPWVLYMIMSHSLLGLHNYQLCSDVQNWTRPR